MRPVVHGPEIVRDLRCVVQTPIVDEQDFVEIDLRPAGRFINDECAIEPSGHLLPSAIVRVVPVGAGIRHGEIVEKIIARLDGHLRQAGDAVHAVGDPDPVPVHARGLGQVVDKAPRHPRALGHADCRPGNRAAKCPDVCLRILRRREAGASLGSDEVCSGIGQSDTRDAEACYGADKRLMELPAVQDRHGCSPDMYPAA